MHGRGFPLSRGSRPRGRILIDRGFMRIGCQSCELSQMPMTRQLCSMHGTLSYVDATTRLAQAGAGNEGPPGRGGPAQTNVVKSQWGPARARLQRGPSLRA
eukprot:9317183-Pyramimonas_sp.AAC.1